MAGLPDARIARISDGRIDAQRIVDLGILEPVALRIGQHVDALHAANGKAFVGILFVVEPVWTFRASAQITLGGAPFFVQHAFHLRLKRSAQDLAEQHAEQHQQHAEEYDVTQGQAEAQSASPAKSFAGRNHWTCSSSVSMAFSGVSSI